MTRLRNLIKEVLSTPPKEKECDCGCGGCSDNGTTLNENINKRVVMTENMQYHVQNQLPLTENTFRYGSKAFLDLWSEARYLYVRDAINVNELDQEILSETHLGEYGIFETVNFEGEEYDIVRRGDDGWIYLRSIHDTMVGKKEIKVKEKDITVNEIKVPLDLPILSEDFDDEDDFEDDDNIYTGPYSYGIDKVTWDNEWSKDKNIYNRLEAIRKMLKKYPKELAKLESDPYYPALDMTYDELVKWYKSISNFDLSEEKGYGADTAWKDEEGNKITLKDILDMTKDIPQKDYPTKKLAKVVLNWDDNPKELERINQVEVSKQYPILIMVDEDEKIKWILDGNHRAQKALKSKSETIPAKLIKPSNLSSKAKKILLGMVDESLNESTKKKNTKKLNKPMRDSSGGKAYKVYVKDPKTKKIKTIRFGSGGLRAKINDKKARNAFAARHKCAQKKDKTKAGYWSCRLPRYAKLLGLKSSFGGFW